MPAASLTLVAAQFSGVQSAFAAGTASISGTVQVGAGLSATGYSVSLYKDGGNVAGTWVPSSPGNYSFANLEPGDYKVHFTAYSGSLGSVGMPEWYDDKELESAALPVTLTAGQSRTGISAVISTGAAISGRITLPSGVAASNVAVFASSVDSGLQTYGEVKSDGTYSVDDLAAGKYRLRFEWSSGGGNTPTPSRIIPTYLGSTSWQEATVLELPRQGSITGQNVTLAPAGVVTGKISAPSGVDLSNVSVSASGGGAYGSTTSSATGDYAIGGLPAGNYNVRFSWMGFDSPVVDSYYGDTSGAGTGTVIAVQPPQTVTNANHTLITAAHIKGKVTVPSGFSSANVLVMAKTADKQEWRGSAQTDATGSFAIGGLPAGSYKLEYSPNNQNLLTQWQGQKSSPEASAPIALTAGQTLTVANEGLLPGASVSGKLTVPAGSATGNGEYATLKGANGDVNYSPVGSDGSYSFSKLPAGAYTIEFSRSSGLTTNLEASYYKDASESAGAGAATPVTLATGESKAGLTSSAKLGGTLTGKVVGSDGQPLNNVPVRVYTKDGSLVTRGANTAADGTFKVTGLTTGNYLVSANMIASRPTGSLGPIFSGNVKTESAASSVSAKVGTNTDIGTLSFGTAAPGGTGFADVPAGAQFSTEIGWMASAGISTGWTEADGTKTFRPLSPVNRDAMAAFMYRLAGKPAFTPPASSPFTDVPTSSQFYKEITWLAAQGISTGWTEADGTKTYRPLQAVNRDAMAAFMYRLAGKPAFTPPASSPFTDVPTSSQFYKEITWLAAQGISTGWTEADGTKTYRPLQAVNRDAMAAFMYRYNTKFAS